MVKLITLLFILSFLNVHTVILVIISIIVVIGVIGYVLQTQLDNCWEVRGHFLWTSVKKTGKNLIYKKTSYLTYKYTQREKALCHVEKVDFLSYKPNNIDIVLPAKKSFKSLKAELA